MENKDNKALRTAFWLLGPLLFYELCTEAAGLACSLFGTQDAMTVTGGGALLALPFLYAAYRKKRSMDMKPMSYPRHLPAGCFFTAVAGSGACLFLNVLLKALMLSDGWSSTREAVYGASLVPRALVTVLLAPLTEELLFRGLIRTELRTHMRTHTAAFLGALLFGLYHGNVSQGIYAFLLALCLELVCEWSGSLLPAVCLHAGANGAAICLTALMSGHAEVFNLPAATFFAAAGAVLAAAALYKTKEVFSKS